MVNIITKYDGNKIIRDCESFFGCYIIADTFTDLDLDVMQRIDGAKLSDASTGAILTGFGTTDIEHLSTGCKIVLTYLWLRRESMSGLSGYILDITECGGNALEVLFSCVDYLKDSETVFLLRHTDNLRVCSDREYNINGNVSLNLRKGVALYG